MTSPAHRAPDGALPGENCAVDTTVIVLIEQIRFGAIKFRHRQQEAAMIEGTTSTGIAWKRPVWEGYSVTNKEPAVALWSGNGGPPPSIGSTVRTAGIVQHNVRVTGYKCVDGWLMLTGYRLDGSKEGDLAGAEIDWTTPVVEG